VRQVQHETSPPKFSASGCRRCRAAGRLADRLGASLSKANPGKINMGSAGIGSAGHLAGELFKMMAAVSLVHVP
jgi:hypothetical protein